MDKKQLIDSLISGEELSKEAYVFYWQNEKVSDEVGFFKIEVLDNKLNILFKFKIQLDLHNPENSTKYENISIGKPKTQVGLVQFESKSILAKIKEGLETAVTEGRIPFLPFT